MIDLDAIFNQDIDLGEFCSWKAIINGYELTIWTGKTHDNELSIPNDVRFGLNNYSSLSFRICINPYYLGLSLSSLQMTALFGRDLKKYPYTTVPPMSNDGRNIPIDIVKDIVEKAINIGKSVALAQNKAIDPSISPCTTCGLFDKWNSMINGRVCCYKHCR